MDPKIHALADASVLALDGSAHPLGDHFREHSGVLLFVRHFG
jgi:hypothetical protein